MIAGVKPKNLHKYLPELSHGNSAVLGSTTVRHMWSSAVAILLCTHSHKITTQ
jgi:hypothetical protein